jgi:NodT family efflux transporter outer membrane factor (OMF) lipoprotein
MTPKIKNVPILPVLMLCLAQAGCVPLVEGIPTREPDASVPATFGAAAASADNLGLLPTERLFRDPNLIKLIEQALVNNQELNILQMEVAIADAEVMARSGEYLPKVSGGASVGLERVGRYTSQGAGDRTHEITPGRRVPENLPSFRLGFFASWEVDLWGRLRDATKAAALRAAATVDGRNFAITRLVAEIANSYYELLALDNQLQVLERNIAIQSQALEVVRAKKAAARDTELAVQRFEAEVLQNRGRLFDILQRITETENRINLLVGRFPEPLARASAGFLQLEPTAIATGLPAQLLANRPDLRLAERQLEAANLEVSVARARYYPALNLDGGAGVEAFDLSRLTTWPESIFFGAFAGLSAPLFNRRVITADFVVATAQRMQAILNFEQTLRQAFVETANQVAMVTNLGQKYTLKAQQVALLEGAIEVSNKLFISARADYMEVLLTRRDALESQLELIETRRMQLAAIVNIYQALGGGWAPAPEPVVSSEVNPDVIAAEQKQ